MVIYTLWRFDLDPPPPPWQMKVESLGQRFPRQKKTLVVSRHLWGLNSGILVFFRGKPNPRWFEFDSILQMFVPKKSSQQNQPWPSCEFCNHIFLANLAWQSMCFLLFFWRGGFIFPNWSFQSWRDLWEICRSILPKKTLLSTPEGRFVKHQKFCMTKSKPVQYGIALPKTNS